MKIINVVNVIFNKLSENIPISNLIITFYKYIQIV